MKIRDTAIQAERIRRVRLLLASLVPLVGANSAAAGDIHYLHRDCLEQVIMMEVEPAPFQGFVGDTFPVDIKEGKAGILIIVQVSQHNYIDGKDVGPSRDVHMWVAVDGPTDGEYTPVIGAERTMDTMSWYKFFGGSANPEVLSVFRKSGLQYKSIRNISMEENEDSIHGKLTFSNGQVLSWSAKPAAPWAQLVGANHDFYARDSSGHLRYTRVQALINVVAWGSPGTMEVPSDIGLDELLPADSYPVKLNAYTPAWVRASLNSPLPEALQNKVP